ncbi:peptide chain release factor N(5)-glutamine methyltransferase [Polynucleobacter sp. AP-Latsch-80-C2]|jgi:release factor glutamine methyltransferase|uniref:peptide chain release factor N(5)-glutamine methyltransferase n=1 Tax=Polynucleobacter sp. AP-Latsch-80-C2 TaxID=2576931 RepID=UPI001C0BD8D1|nr:peptide chain release factor N(5)-glutamine methyltransferase [Polynucleobacter sp. AP-Latsch-80-C2]MBU3623391.1 peptide chain release factor N(5)-glutamine methyltransferase [Polynucleobacter sp. AP-Latsch-80-C2]
MRADLSLRDLLRSSTLPQSEARLLLAHVLEQHYQLPRSALLSRDEMTLNADALADWKMLEAKRLDGEPIAYLVGKKGFHNIELLVAPGVLIPRPETELLVEIGLREITQLGGKAKLLDLGTGSGAIALAIASAAPSSFVIATDQSPDALAIARLNAKQLHLEGQVQFAQGNWYDAISKEACFDLILSNPPYIESGDPHLTQGDLRFEPLNALTDEANGLSCLERIISKASQHLNPKGLIAVEHGFDQSDAVVDLMRSAGLLDIQTHLDLAGHRRVASGRK